MYDRLTKSDIEKMEREINRRRIELRPKLLEALNEARAQGDLSENFEYYAAKREKNRNESRIRYLQRMINTATIIGDDEGADGEVGLGREVEVYFPDDDETETFRIVTTIRGNSLRNMISIDSPLGKALLHRKAGETVRVKIGDGGYDAVIRSVSGPVDDSGDEIRGF